jgi:hypothetical protein
MTTVRSSWRGRSLAALALGLTALAAATASAHRRDEYLQAARIAIDPGRVQIALDLTPGIALAQAVLAEIDRDGNGLFAAAEEHDYSARVLSELQLEVDGQPLPLELIDHRFPTVQAIFKGEGTIQLQLAATVPSLPAGGHRVSYRNAHHPDIGVYLANALVPASARVAVLAQRRDAAQRELVVEYVLRGDAETRRRWWLPAGGAAAIVIVSSALWRRYRRRT